MRGKRLDSIHGPRATISDDFSSDESGESPHRAVPASVARTRAVRVGDVPRIEDRGEAARHIARRVVSRTLPFLSFRKFLSLFALESFRRSDKAPAIDTACRRRIVRRGRSIARGLANRLESNSRTPLPAFLPRRSTRDRSRSRSQRDPVAGMFSVHRIIASAVKSALVATTSSLFFFFTIAINSSSPETVPPCVSCPFSFFIFLFPSSSPDPTAPLRAHRLRFDDQHETPPAATLHRRSTRPASCHPALF